MAETPIQDDDMWETVAERRAAEALIVDVDGFEGPLDVLLTLSNTWPSSKRRGLCASNWPPITWSWRPGSPF